ncbi:hypothetical protein HHK36_017192 [Tetracentron sinense]|uniref:Annexin n=1 Tax=Tetracentron sinense TaxID=13715 RepID=A0A834Z2R2_TETSI|nr:hypothetical protein HHK36_017192 [Tetracentron sinense]
MHPWERDARMAKEALSKGAQSYDVLIEIACTRSSEELLGARRAYHSLFDHSIEEDIAYCINDSNRKLLVALVSSYRYEGSMVNEEIAKSEAKTLCIAIKNSDKKKAVEDDEVVRILTTRSKLHLKAIFKHYKEMCSKTLDEDVEDDLNLKETVQCLCSPQTYFSKVKMNPSTRFQRSFASNMAFLAYFYINIFAFQVLEMALKGGVDENTKEALTRVIVTQADGGMKEIKEEYHKQYGVSLSQKIQETTYGNYKDFLLTLVARGN